MLRHTVRALSRAPVFVLATVATLAIAIGATTAIVSVADGVLLEPLPFPQSDRLVAVRHLMPVLDDAEHDGSPAFYFTYRDNKVFERFDLARVDNARIDRDAAQLALTGDGRLHHSPARGSFDRRVLQFGLRSFHVLLHLLHLG